MGVVVGSSWRANVIQTHDLRMQSPPKHDPTYGTKTVQSTMSVRLAARAGFGVARASALPIAAQNSLQGERKPAGKPATPPRQKQHDTVTA